MNRYENFKSQMLSNPEVKAEYDALEPELYPDEETSMCQAIEQMREESRLEGEIKGRLEGKLEGQIEGAIFAYKNMGMALSDVIKQISKQFKMTESESDQAIKQYWT